MYPFMYVVNFIMCFSFGFIWFFIWILIYCTATYNCSVFLSLIYYTITYNCSMSYLLNINSPYNCLYMQCVLLYFYISSTSLQHLHLHLLYHYLNNTTTLYLQCAPRSRLCREKSRFDTMSTPCNSKTCQVYMHLLRNNSEYKLFIMVPSSRSSSSSSSIGARHWWRVNENIVIILTILTILLFFSILISLSIFSLLHDNITSLFVYTCSAFLH